MVGNGKGGSGRQVYGGEGEGQVVTLWSYKWSGVTPASAAWEHLGDVTQLTYNVENKPHAISEKKKKK